MNWKENLEKLMSENNHYRLDLLNKQLYSWCKEWTDSVNEFNDMRAQLTSERKEYSGSFITLNLIKVYDKENLSFFPFKAYLGYFVSQDRKLTLHMATTERVSTDIDVITGSAVRGDRESDGLYIWHSENEISDAEITEQGFVLQLLNNRFKDFFKWYKQTS